MTAIVLTAQSKRLSLLLSRVRFRAKLRSTRRLSLRTRPEPSRRYSRREPKRTRFVPMCGGPHCSVTSVVLRWSNARDGSHFNFSAMSFQGETPLHIAARDGLAETVETLLKAGCDMEAKTTDWVRIVMRPVVSRLPPRCLTR